MFVLDTNVISELRKAKSGKADENVIAWATGVSPGALFLSAITVLELETGVLLVERRDPSQGATLRAWLDHQVLPAFAGRVLGVDTAVAQRCARLHVPDPPRRTRRPDRGHGLGARHDDRDPKRCRLCAHRRANSQSLGADRTACNVT